MYHLRSTSGCDVNCRYNILKFRARILLNSKHVLCQAGEVQQKKSLTFKQDVTSILPF